MSLHPCPECQSKVELAEAPRISEIVECSDCGAVLEVVSVEPVLLALAPEIQEDWGE